ncbi:MAG TPA: phospholipase D-like domain-containing protein, partial [Burkholderiales bacterium]
MKTKRLPTIIAGVIAAAVITLLVLNFTTGEKRVREQVQHQYDVADPQFLRAMGVLLGPPLLEGNRVTTLLNGDQIFPAMLQAIRSAQKTITFETYIYWSGAIGKEFSEALADRAKNGVRVHVTLDWLGSQKMEEQQIEAMRKAGVEVHKYHPPHWYTLNRFNNRTHRKLLVVDGKTGFTGGVGIAD